jgi:protein-L-isoaspartate(D-aspartate) O-methyltransferase
MTEYPKIRENMVKGQLLPGGVIDPLIIKSFSSLPREMFVLEKMQKIAYLDENIPLGQGRYLISPLAHALLLQSSAPQSEDIVLDIGCASGYSSAILSTLVTTIIALEYNRRQMDKAVRLWEKMELCNIALIEDDNLINGHAKRTPYSLIIINGSVPHVPDVILQQLAPNGRLACFKREKRNAVCYAAIYHKGENGSVACKKLFDAAVPDFEDFIQADEFHF